MYVNSILKKITKISSGSITLITLYFKGTRSFRFFLQQDFRQHFKKSCMTVHCIYFFFDKDFILVDSIHTKRIYEN